MLVLTRKLNEGIIVDGDVEITVLQVRGNRIRLGIRAPEHVSIRRGELSPLGPEPLTEDTQPIESKSVESKSQGPFEVELPTDPSAN